MQLIPVRARLTRSLEGYLRRKHLTERTRGVIAQDRREQIAASTGWQPPAGITAGRAPRHE